MKITQLKNIRVTSRQVAAMFNSNPTEISNLEKSGLIPERDEKKTWNLCEFAIAYSNAQGKSIDLKTFRCTAVQVANVIGVSSQRINALEKEGRIARGKDKLFGLAETVQEYVAGIKDKIKKDGPSEIFENARARQKVADAELSIMALQKRKGELVEIHDVLNIVKQEYAIVRQRLYSIPSKTALDVFSCETPHEVQELLTGHLNEVMSELKYDTGGNAAGHQIENSETSTDTETP